MTVDARHRLSDEACAAAPTDDGVERVRLAHGGGGRLTDERLARAVFPALGVAADAEHYDGALLAWEAGVDGEHGAGRLAFTIDGYVVQPWRFPGGDVGRLAVCGSINDLAVMGARPLGLALSVVLEEGFPLADVEAILRSIGEASREARVPVVTGDTKVVGRGQADGVYLTTAGVGRCGPWRPDYARLRPGDALLVTGTIAEHGLAVMLAREMPELESAIASDVAPLHTLLLPLIDALGEELVFMRDATRAGLAGVAVDLAEQGGVRIVLDEASVPIRGEARHAADLLGLDPLEIANEGKAVVVVREGAVERTLAILQRHPLGRAAAVVGTVEVGTPRCELATELGGRRIVQKPYGEQLPRIC